MEVLVLVLVVAVPVEEEALSEKTDADTLIPEKPDCCAAAEEETDEFEEDRCDKLVCEGRITSGAISCDERGVECVFCVSIWILFS